MGFAPGKNPVLSGNLSHLAYLHSAPAQAPHVRGTDRPKRVGLLEANVYRLVSHQFHRRQPKKRIVSWIWGGGAGLIVVGVRCDGSIFRRHSRTVR